MRPDGLHTRSDEAIVSPKARSVSPGLSQGELVDRLLDKIAVLELELKERQAEQPTNNSKEQLIKAVRGESWVMRAVGKVCASFRSTLMTATHRCRCMCWHRLTKVLCCNVRAIASIAAMLIPPSNADPSRSNSPQPPRPRSSSSSIGGTTGAVLAAAAPATLNPHQKKELLHTLGDPDQQQLPSIAVESSSSEWFSNVSSWVRQRTSSVVAGKGGPPAAGASSRDAAAAAAPADARSSRRTNAVSAGGSAAQWSGGGLAGGGGTATASSTWGMLKQYSR